MHTSTLILLGLASVPDRLYSAKVGNSRIKNSMPASSDRSYRRVIIKKDQRERLVENILLYLGNGVTGCARMYDEMLKKQANEGIELLPTNDFGDILSLYSFRDLLLEVKRQFPGAIKNTTNKREEIAKMYIDRFSKKEISVRYGITEVRVHRILVEQGLIKKRKMKEMQGGNNGPR